MKTTLHMFHSWRGSEWALLMTLGLAAALPLQPATAEAPAATGTAAAAPAGEAAATEETAAEEATEADATPNVAGENALTGSVTPELYLLRNRGNQAWLRRYEGQRERDRPFALGTLNVTGYNRSLQYFIDGSDVFSHDSSLNAEVGLTNTFWLRAYTNGMTRRIAAPYPSFVPTATVFQLGANPNNFLSLPVIPPFVMAPSRLPFDAVVPLNGLTPYSQFGIDRDDDGAKLTVKPFKSDVVQFFGDFWTSEQSGTRPLIFRSRRSAQPTAAVPGVSGIKFLTTDPVDSTTSETGIGLNATLGPALVSYRVSRHEYENRVAGPFLPPGFPPAPTSSERIFDSRYNNTDSTNHNAKLAVPLGSSLAFNGTWIRRNRTHDTAGLVLLDNPVPGTATPIVLTEDVKSRLDTKSGTLRYSGMDNLLLTARYRDFSLNRTAPLVVSGAAAILQNQSISRQEKEGELEASYSGLNSTLIRASISKTDTERALRPVHQPIAGGAPAAHEEWEHPAVAEKSDTKTFRLGATSHIVSNVSLRANWKKSKTRHSAYHGTPSDSDELSLGVNYTPRDDMGFFLDLRRLDEKNKLIAAPGFLTTALLAAQNPGLTPAEIATLYTEMREAEAGAQYSNKADTIVLGLFKSFGTKLTLDANFTSDKTKSQSYWVFGIDSAFPPHPGGQGDPTGLGPELVPYNAKNRTVSAGLTYAATPKLSLRSNILYGRSDGETNTVSLFRLVPPAQNAAPDGVWQPFSTRLRRVGIGASYRTSATQQVLVQLDFNDWKDKIEAAYSGKYTLLTVGWKADF